jgi:hypothetical protein
MPEVMLSKCAEGQALRVAFPQQLEGLYNNEEMDQAAPKAARVEVQQIAMPRPVDPEPEEEPQPPIPPDPDDDFILRDVGITAVQPKVAQKSGSKYWEIVTVDGEILLTNSQAVASRADDAARTFAICDLVYEKAGNRNVLTDVRILSGEEAPIG